MTTATIDGVSSTTSLPAALRADIFGCGYFPQIVADATQLAIAGEGVLGHFVHHEATINHEEVGRHLSVVVLTPTRLIVNHTDDSALPGESPNAVTTTESVPLRLIKSVAVSQLVANPDSYDTRRSSVAEAWLAIAWGTVKRVDVEPAACADPNCDADHGYSGETTEDDLNIRVSAAADGPALVRRLLEFAAATQLACGKVR